MEHQISPTQPDSTFAFGLMSREVERFRDIMRREYGEELDREAVWARAIEVLALFRMLVGPAPEASSVESSSIGAVDGNEHLSNR